MALFDSYIIWPDVAIVGGDQVFSVTSQANPTPGAVTAADANVGRLQPLPGSVWGTALDATAEPVRLTLTRGGSINSALFGWRPDDESKLRGVHDPRMFWGNHSPFNSTTPGPSNCAMAMDWPNKRLVAIGAVSGTTVLRWATRNLADRYDLWTTQSTATLVQAAGGSSGGAAVDMPDGSILYALLVPDRIVGSSYDIDLYLLKNGVWTNINQSIMARFRTSSWTYDVTATIRLARSGEVLRLSLPDSAGELINFISYDRGATWSQLDDGPTVFDNGDADDPFPYDVKGVGNAGEFHLVYATSADDYNHGIAWGDSAWSLPALGQRTTGIAASTEIKVLCLVEDCAYINCYVFLSDMTAGDVDYWMMERAPKGTASSLLYTSGADGWSGSSGLDFMLLHDGCDRYSGRLRACWAGDRIAFYGSTKLESTGANSGSVGQCSYIGGWVHYPYYGMYWTDDIVDAGGGSLIFTDNSGGLAGCMWLNTNGSPENMFGTGWVQTVSGTGSNSSTDDRLEIVATTATSTDYWTHGVDTGIGFSGQGVCTYYLDVRIDTGDSTTASDNVAVKFQHANNANTTRTRTTLRIGSTTMIVRDDIAGTTLGTATLNQDTGSTGGFTQVEVAFYHDGSASKVKFRGYNAQTGDAVELGPFTTSTEAAGTSQVQFGHLGQTQATQMRSWWRAFGWSKSTSGMGFNTAYGLTISETVLPGLPCAAEPIYVAYGYTATWAGFAGSVADNFLGSIGYAYAFENTLSGGSPQVVWRSTSAVAQTVILDLGAENTGNRAYHDAVAMFNVNSRTVIVDYDTASSFASPSTAQTLDFTAFGTGASAVTVSNVTGNVVTFSGTMPWKAGELVGFSLRPTSGPASGLTYKITAHPDAATVVCGDETSLTVTSPNTCVVLAPQAFLFYSANSPKERYCRLRFTDTDTASGVHQAGVVLLGRKQLIDPPLDWQHTEDEEPNEEDFMTRAGIGWVQKNGPPQRTFLGRLVGDDVDSRARDVIRGMLRQGRYGVSPQVLIVDSNKTWTPIYGRLKPISEDNAGWGQDTAGYYQTVGDAAIQFVEQT